MSGELARLARLVVANAAGALPSPGGGVWRRGAGGGRCGGGCRTLQEIAGWSQMDDAGKREVWRQIGQRAQEPKP